MRIFDAHLHIQPWRMIRPEARALLGPKNADRADLEAMMYDPDRVVAFLDSEGVERACVINYVAPEVMGFTEEANEFSGALARRHPGRIVAFGSVHPMRSRDPRGDVRRLVEETSISGLKVHPSHQLFRPNAYRDGLKALAEIYAEAQERDIPVMVHTGTSIFPGARNVYADPIYLEDVGVDYPELRVIVAHGGRPIWMPTALFLIRRFPRWRLDISSIPPAHVARFFPGLERMADRVLFGSDWPAPGVPGIRANAVALGGLGYAPEVVDRMLFANAAAFFGR